MLAARTQKTTTVVVTSTTKTTARRGATVVRKNSKGGEEGAPAFGNDAYGTDRTTRDGSMDGWMDGCDSDG